MSDTWKRFGSDYNSVNHSLGGAADWLKGVASSYQQPQQTQPQQTPQPQAQPQQPEQPQEQPTQPSFLDHLKNLVWPQPQYPPGEEDPDGGPA